MSDHKHRYAKLNDRAVFCDGCGDIKVEPVAFAPCPFPHFTWTYVPPTYPAYYPPFVVTSGSTTVFDVTDSSYADNATYTS